MHTLFCTAVYCHAIGKNKAVLYYNVICVMLESETYHVITW